MLFPRNVGWVCVSLPRTLTLFIIQIYNFCSPFYDLLKFKNRYPIFDPCSWHSNLVPRTFSWLGGGSQEARERVLVTRLLVQLP